MPLTRFSKITVIATTAPAAGFTLAAIEASLIDHIQLWVAFTKGSLTSYTYEPEFSIDGVTWWDVYDTNQTQISYVHTANFTGTFPLGSTNTAARMQPLAICVPLLRFVGVLAGTTTSSSIAIDATAFSLGGGQD